MNQTQWPAESLELLNLPPRRYTWQIWKGSWSMLLVQKGWLWVGCSVCNSWFFISIPLILYVSQKVWKNTTIFQLILTLYLEWHWLQSGEIQDRLVSIGVLARMMGRNFHCFHMDSELAGGSHSCYSNHKLSSYWTNENGIKVISSVRSWGWNLYPMNND